MSDQIFHLTESKVTSCEAEVIQGRENAPITCPLNAGHRRAWRVPGSVTIDTDESDSGECLWTPLADCLLSDTVISELRAKGITGFATGEVHATGERFIPYTYFQLLVRGWGGLARKECGIELVYSCDGCGYQKYSSLLDPTQMFDVDSWDGSDVFMIWPLPQFIFVTSRVVDAFRNMHVSGVEFQPIEEVVTTGTGFAPGRLSHFFPAEQAARIGMPLGIA